MKAAERIEENMTDAGKFVPGIPVKVISKYKYQEDNILQEVKDYIDSTYGQHYVGNGEIQTIDFWESLGSLDTTARDTAIKYLARFGKKGGNNRKDLLKAIHYIILMMYATREEQQ
jgi:hypothetical protein